MPDNTQNNLALQITFEGGGFVAAILKRAVQDEVINGRVSEKITAAFVRSQLSLLGNMGNTLSIGVSHLQGDAFRVGEVLTTIYGGALGERLRLAAARAVSTETGTRKLHPITIFDKTGGRLLGRGRGEELFSEYIWPLMVENNSRRASINFGVTRMSLAVASSEIGLPRSDSGVSYSPYAADGQEPGHSRFTLLRDENRTALSDEPSPRKPSSAFVHFDTPYSASLKEKGRLADIVNFHNMGRPTVEHITVEELRMVNGLTLDMDRSIRVGQPLLVPHKINGNLVVDYANVPQHANLPKQHSTRKTKS